LRKDDEMITKDKKEMEVMTTKFFQDLYTADPSVAPEELIQLFWPINTEEINSFLCKEFSNDEIGDALFQMGPLKALGPDGFPTRFFNEIGEY
jgi:hypothetical protein